jgi:hypothetical protein
MKLKITKQFDFAHRGCDVKTYAKGEEIDTDTADPELVKLVTEEGWATKPRAKAEGQGGKEPADPPPADKPDPAPPENPAPQP